jgi:hypothetical protein
MFYLPFFKEEKYVQRVANRDMYRIPTPVKPDMIKSGLVSPDLVRPKLE